jgi:hypothetical protein
MPVENSIPKMQKKVLAIPKIFIYNRIIKKGDWMKVTNKVTKESGVLIINEGQFMIYISPDHWIPVYDTIEELHKYGWEVSGGKKRN